MNATVRWQRCDKIVGTNIEDSFVVLSPEASSYFAFNPSATDIWDLLAEPRSPEQIVAVLMEKYEVSHEICANSVYRILDELSVKGLASPVN